MNRLRQVSLAILACGLVAYVLTGAYRVYSFEWLVAHEAALVSWAAAHPALSAAAWAAAYLALGMFVLPGSTVLNVTAGALFAFPKGLLLVAATGTIVSSLAFLTFRYLFADSVEAAARKRFPHAFAGLERDGLYFVFALRLLPIVPYSAVNLILAVSPVRFWPCQGISLLALLPRYVLYVYAGTQLGRIRSLGDLLSPGLIGALSLVAVLPWVVHRLLAWKRSRSPS